MQVWAHYEEQPVEEVTPVLEEKERSATYKPVFVTEITDDLHFYVQDVETGEFSGPAWALLPQSSWHRPAHHQGPLFMGKTGHGPGALGTSPTAPPHRALDTTL